MIWLNVKGYAGEYQLSEKGDLRRRTQERGSYYVKSCVSSNGKLYVTLWKNGKRKTYMLHNLYAETFHLPVKAAKQILYEGYVGNATAKNNVRTWLLEKIQECEKTESFNGDMHDEILYLRSFLNQVNDLI